MLGSKLMTLPAEEILAFDQIYDEMRARAYRWDLWGAAYLLNGGCSDDGFEYFRGWLIAQGEKVFQNSLSDPDGLADVVTDEQIAEAFFESEEMLYVARQAYEAKTGAEMPPYESAFAYAEPGGERWTEDELKTLLPKLWAKTEMAEAEPTGG